MFKSDFTLTIEPKGDKGPYFTFTRLGAPIGEIQTQIDRLPVWIVGQAKERDVPAPRWEFQGVFLEEKDAIAACLTDMYFIAPAVLGSPLPHEQIDWPGARYPKAEGV